MKKIATAFVAGLTMAVVAIGHASAWEPRKPIDFIIMAGEGGGADRMARLMQSVVEAEGLASKPLVPINKPGGSGAEALVHLSNATDPDHTIMVTLNSFFTTPLRQPNLGIDILEFAPVGRMAEDTFILWVHKDSGLTTFDEFLQQAEAEGSNWVMGGTGTNQEDQILTDFLNTNFNLSMKYIPYKGGGSVAKDLAGQQIHSSVNNPSEALGFYEAGDVVPLVSFTSERLPLFPDVPTISETGTNFAYYMQRAVVGAPGMSTEAQEYYQGVFDQVYHGAKWQEYRSDKSLVGDYLSGPGLMAYWEVQRMRHETILREMGAIR